jgi:hypothetical protein
MKPLPRHDLSPLDGNEGHLRGITESRRNPGSKKGDGDFHLPGTIAKAMPKRFIPSTKRKMNDFI